MRLKQDAWVLYLRAISVNGESNMVPFWGQVGELQVQDVVWSEDIRKYICIEKFHKDLDMLVIDEISVGTPSPENEKIMNEKIIKTTDKMFSESDFNSPGKRTKGFRKNSIIYLSSLPDCVKWKFGFNVDD